MVTETAFQKQLDILEAKLGCDTAQYRMALGALLVHKIIPKVIGHFGLWGAKDFRIIVEPHFNCPEVLELALQCEKAMRNSVHVEHLEGDLAALLGSCDE